MSTLSDHAPLLERAFSFVPAEGDYRIDDVEGEVPAFLRGSYYVNGPARFFRGDLRYGHWLDGDGMVCALHFDGQGGVRFVNRFVRSTKRNAEEAAGAPLFRAFGTAFPGDQLKRGIGLESPVNVSVYPAAGTLLAFGEQGLPWELDPVTLETRGEFTFGGRLNAISPFSAHPKADLDTGELFNFGVSFSARHPCVHLYRFDAAGESVYRKRLPLDLPRSVHDFSLSPSYAVIYLSPYVLDMEPLMAGTGTLMDALRWQPDLGSKLLLARREDGEPVAEIAIGDRYCLHLINSFERPDGHLVVDVVELDQPVYDQYLVPELFPEVRTSEPVRFVIDPAAGKLVARQPLPFHLMCDFPAIDPRRAEQETHDFWVLAISATDQPGRKFFDQVVHLSWPDGGVAGVYQAPPHCYLGGEPVFLPDPANPGAGAVICQQLNADAGTSAFLIFDAFNLAAGPVATLHLHSPVHLAFHACYHPA